MAEKLHNEWHGGCSSTEVTAKDAKTHFDAGDRSLGGKVKPWDKLPENKAMLRPTTPTKIFDLGTTLAVIAAVAFASAFFVQNTPEGAYVWSKAKAKYEWVRDVSDQYRDYDEPAWASKALEPKE